MAGMSRLGAIHFFNRAPAHRQSSLVRNLSYQLGLFDSRLGAAIADGLLSNPRVLALPLPDQLSSIGSYASTLTVIWAPKDLLWIIVANNLLLKLADDWPGEENLDALCVRSSGLFAWCAAAMKFIETGQDPRERLATVLGNDQSGLWFDGTFVKDFQRWMGIALLVLAATSL
ncbi:hypothetical protein R3P38DRAFT_2813281 [Favolaschia claudopus]|uniref:Uncharacterized protein n=1 Tax=Favolaschia claudopus TaxID=2862362 RepID=A0AAV9Z5I2_9AGAR